MCEFTVVYMIQIRKLGPLPKESGKIRIKIQTLSPVFLLIDKQHHYS